MVKVQELCNRRRIEKLGLTTPFLIPSFSSKGFPDLEWILSRMKPYITDLAMVSSYDIFHLDLGDELVTPNVLFVDSGGYEARRDHDLSEIYAHEYEPREWTRELHLRVLSDLEVPSALVLVSFDAVKRNQPLERQVEHANGFFEQYPHAVSDFLIKPYERPHIDVDRVIGFSEEFEAFDVVGFTEKELGPSLTDRLRSVVRIRRAFSAVGSDVPIHVFGCLDPLAVQLFYLCGADIFDGLSWLRFAFHNSVAIYRNNWMILENRADLSDDQALLWSGIENLSYLACLTRGLGRYAESFDPEALDIDPQLTTRILSAIDVLT